jgi:hypothetical protein
VSESWEAEVFRVPDIAWQAEVPPTRHPVPVRYVAELQVGDVVTIGVPGQYFIDDQVVALAERDGGERGDGTGGQGTLAVAAPFAYWLAKGFPRAGLTMQWWPIAHCWAYRDAASADEHAVGQRQTVDDDAGSWLDHVQSTLHVPPVRHARAAREAGALTGRTLRMQHEPGAWSWWVGVSEPVDVGGDVVVHVMRPSDYWLSQAACEPTKLAQPVPLYRLYVYA